MIRAAGLFRCGLLTPRVEKQLQKVEQPGSERPGPVFLAADRVHSAPSAK